MRQSVGLAAGEQPGTWLTLSAERRGPGDGFVSFVETSEQGVVVEDVPDAVLHFLEPDAVAAEGLGEELLAGVESKGTGVADAADFDMPRVVRWCDSLWIGAR